MKVLASFFFVLLVSACNNKNTSEYLAISENGETISTQIIQEHPGKKLMENNYYVCHNPKTSEERMMAPPMIAVKMHYISEDTSKEEFINTMVEWSKKPSEEKSKMPGVVKKFGLMPYQFFPEKTIQEIADYMFDNELEEPVWFEEHYKKMHGNRPKMKDKNGMGKGMGKNQVQNSQLSNEVLGMEMAQSTKAELGKNLMGQIQKNGVIAALDFCNIKAMPITDSMATVHKAHIKRVTDRPRNPVNKANATELGYINTFKSEVANGEEVNPIVTTMDKEVQFYYPITTNSMCLKCHGTPGKELEPLTLQKIKELYPTDVAIGYDENEVRGIWSIKFEN